MLFHPKRYIWAYDSRNSYLTLTSPIPPGVQVVDSGWNRERKEKNKQTNKQTTTTTKQQKEWKKKKGGSLALLPYSPSSFFLLTSLSRSRSLVAWKGRDRTSPCHWLRWLFRVPNYGVYHFGLLHNPSSRSLKKTTWGATDLYFFIIIKCTCRQKRSSDLILFL